jgi:hypothetical protein
MGANTSRLARGKREHTYATPDPARSDEPVVRADCAAPAPGAGARSVRAPGSHCPSPVRVRGLPLVVAPECHVREPCALVDAVRTGLGASLARPPGWPQLEGGLKPLSLFSKSDRSL